MTTFFRIPSPQHQQRSLLAPSVLRSARKIAACSVALAFAQVAYAGDRLPVVSVLFSPDNQRALATVAGTQDGSGVAQAQVVVLDTASGREVRNAALRGTDTSLTPAAVLNELLRREQSVLSSSGFQVRRGSTLRYRKVFPAGAPTWNEGLQVGESSLHEVKLWSKPVPIRLSVQKGAGTCSGGQLPTGEGPARFVLNVNGQDIAPVNNLPACAARYALERVDLSGNRVLFTVRAYTAGADGPNAEPLFVSALLK